MLDMITFIVENVTKAGHRTVLNEILAGKFSHKARGNRKDFETFEINLQASEYAAVRDELLKQKHEEMMEQQDSCYQDVYEALPKTINVEDNDTVTISLNEN